MRAQMCVQRQQTDSPPKANRYTYNRLNSSTSESSWVVRWSADVPTVKAVTSRCLRRKCTTRKNFRIFFSFGLTTCDEIWGDYSGQLTPDLADWRPWDEVSWDCSSSASNWGIYVFKYSLFTLSQRFQLFWLSLWMCLTLLLFTILCFSAVIKQLCVEL